MHFLQVIVPLKLEWVPTFSCDAALKPGTPVNVRLSGREYVGIVWKSDVTPDIEESRISPIDSIETDMPAVSKEELRLWDFISDYYMCTLGEVYKAAYPYSRLASEQTASDILRRLHERLARCEAKLEKKHKEAVTQRLLAEKSTVLELIDELEGGMPTTAPKATPGKPTVFIGEGRREKYSEAIRKALLDGRQALILTPEIAFCNNLESYLSEEFGNALLVVNSTRSAVQRRKVAEALRKGRSCVVLGTRTALFLPFTNLSLVIIDEEQDSSYKQNEPAPRLNGRDTALTLARIHGAQALLGTACPSMETLHNCLSGKFELKRNEQVASNCEIIDVGAERRKNGMIGVLSRKLMDAVCHTAGDIIFIRGWEKKDELSIEMANAFRDRHIDVVSLREFKMRKDASASLIAVLQADALVSKDDFRSDERALQLIAMLDQFSDRVIIQTAVPTRFDGSRSPEALLAERRQFGFPPFTRIVDVRKRGTNELIDRHFLQRSQSLAQEKAAIAASLDAGSYADVDPS